MPRSGGEGQVAKSGIWGFGVGELEGAYVVVLTDEDDKGIVSLARHESMPSPTELALPLREAFAARGRPRKIVVPDGGTAKALRGAGIREDIVVGSAARLLEALAALGGEEEDEELDLSLAAAFESAMGELVGVREHEGARFLVEGPALGIANGMLRAITVSERNGWMLYFTPEDARTVVEKNREGVQGFDADTMVAHVEPLGPGASREDREAARVAGLGELEAVLLRNRRTGAKEPRNLDYELAAALTQALVEIARAERAGVIEVRRRVGEAEVTVSGPLR